MKLILTPDAAKALRSVPKRDALALMDKLETFAADPYAPHGWAKAFGEGVARVRHGDWRAVCEIFQDRLVVVVVRIGHRREVYPMIDTVTLSRAEYEALLERAEDAEDRLALIQTRARREAIGEEAWLAECLPAELMRRMIEGESPVRIWREHRGLTGKALAETAGVQPGYLSEIETGKKPGSLDAMARIARALKVPMEDLVWVGD